jgi:hypothetical protein
MSSTSKHSRVYARSSSALVDEVPLYVTTVKNAATAIYFWVVVDVYKGPLVMESR